MMASPIPKRKRESSYFDSARLRKRQKPVNYEESQNSQLHSTQPVHSQGGLWTARAILAEKVVKGKKHYLIDWEGTDPATGEPYEPSWGNHCTEALLKEWRRQRAARGSRTPSPSRDDEAASETKPSIRRRRPIAESETPASSRRRSLATPSRQSRAPSTREDSTALSRRDSLHSVEAGPHFQSDRADRLDVLRTQKTNFDHDVYESISLQAARYSPDSKPSPKSLQSPSRSTFPSPPRESGTIILDSQSPPPELSASDQGLPQPEIPLSISVSCDSTVAALRFHGYGVACQGSERCGHVLDQSENFNKAAGRCHCSSLYCSCRKADINNKRVDNNIQDRTPSNIVPASATPQFDPVKDCCPIHIDTELTVKPETVLHEEINDIASSNLLEPSPPPHQAYPTSNSISAAPLPGEHIATSTESDQSITSNIVSQSLLSQNEAQVAPSPPAAQPPQPIELLTAATKQPTSQVDWDSFYRITDETTLTQGETTTCSDIVNLSLTEPSQPADPIIRSAEEDQPQNSDPASIAVLEPSSILSPPQHPSQVPDSAPPAVVSSRGKPQSSGMAATRRSGRVIRPSGSATPSGEAPSSPRNNTVRSSRNSSQALSRRTRAVLRRTDATGSPADSASSNEKLEQLQTGDANSVEGDAPDSPPSVAPKQESAASSPKRAEGDDRGTAQQMSGREMSPTSVDGVEVKDASASSSSTSDEEAEQGPTLDMMEFIVPLPMTGSAIEQYTNTLAYNASVTRKFCAKTWPEDAAVYGEAVALIQTLRDITLNVDFTNKTLSKDDANDPVMLSEWYRTISSKFKFLHHFLEEVQGQPIHVVVVWKREGLGTMLENFFTGMSMPWVRAHQLMDSKDVLSEKSFMITILSADGSGVENITKAPDLLLTMDQSIDVNEPYIQSLRKLTTNLERLVPVLSLEVLNSIDHIDHSIASSFTGTQRLRLLLHCAATLRKSAGRLKGFPPIKDAAMEVASFVSMKGSESTWPLPPIGSLDDQEVWGLVQAEVPLPPTPPGKSPSPGRRKRRFDAFHPRPDEWEVESEPAKRMRMTPQADGDNSPMRITDSAAGPSSNDEKTAMKSEEQSWWREQVKAAETRAQEQEAVAKSKEELLRAEAKRCQELEKTVSELQYRYEDQSKEARLLKGKVEELETSLGMAQKQRESRDNTIVTLKEEITHLNKDLSDARSLLLNSEVPEIARLEHLRQERDIADERARKANKRADDNEQLIGYLRQQHTETGERVLELNQQNEDFRTRLQKIEKTASGEVTKAREMTLQSQTKMLISENERLKRLVAERERLLLKKEEELKQRRLPISTRAGSVPRSPRIGPTSRAGSPAPDRRVGALKSNNNL